MKIKFKVGEGRCVFEYANPNATLDEAIRILQDPNVLSISVIKCTPNQYLKNPDILKEEEK